jgi:hypothetical protein
LVEIVKYNVMGPLREVEAQDAYVEVDDSTVSERMWPSIHNLAESEGQ